MPRRLPHVFVFEEVRNPLLHPRHLMTRLPLLRLLLHLTLSNLL